MHRRHGVVFGVSLDRAKPVGLPAELSQIEVEYWSTLVPKSAAPDPAALPSESLIAEVQAELRDLFCGQLEREEVMFSDSSS